MTNFERIKSMNVEEMAVFIEKAMPNFGWLDECVVDCFYDGNCAKNCIINWLNSESEETSCN